MKLLQFSVRLSWVSCNFIKRFCGTACNRHHHHASPSWSERLQSCAQLQYSRGIHAERNAVFARLRVALPSALVTTASALRILSLPSGYLRPPERPCPNQDGARSSLQLLSRVKTEVHLLLWRSRSCSRRKYRLCCGFGGLCISTFPKCVWSGCLGNTARLLINFAHSLIIVYCTASTTILVKRFSCIANFPFASLVMWMLL